MLRTPLRARVGKAADRGGAAAGHSSAAGLTVPNCLPPQLRHEVSGPGLHCLLRGARSLPGSAAGQRRRKQYAPRLVHTSAMKGFRGELGGGGVRGGRGLQHAACAAGPMCSATYARLNGCHNSCAGFIMMKLGMRVGKARADFKVKVLAPPSGPASCGH